MNKIQLVNDEFALYLSKDIQSHDVFDFLLDYTERADTMVISSFAITEAYIRRIIRNRYRLGHITMLLDFTIASRNPRIALYAANNVDELYLVNNHSKMIYVHGNGKQALTIMSNNATNNHRYEAGIITTRKDIIGNYLVNIDQMKADSILYG